MLKKAFSGLAAALFTLIPLVAFADDAAAAHGGGMSEKALLGIAAALAIAIAALGGALGQGRAAAATLEGIARNPGAADKLFTPMLLGLALIESLVIYALLIALRLAGFF
jgi:F-type H+-transporting ATPase subunit c